MKSRNLLLVIALVAALAPAGYTFFQKTDSAQDISATAEKYLATLSEKQRAQSLLEFDTPKRVGWHFIPKEFRKGVQIREMSQPQRTAALALLRSALSQMGYGKATKIMELESILHKLEGERRRFARDSQRYYFTVFGKPTAKGKWGLSIEGHHMSLNFVVNEGKVIASTPQMWGANPATVKGDYIPSVKKGTRVLAQEEQLGFDLVKSLNDEQRKAAVIAEKAPREVRAAGEAQPPTTAPVGISAAKLNRTQAQTLRKLLAVYVNDMPREVAAERRQKIQQAGFDKVHFAWAGPTEPGIGHYYRVQGPTFLIEFVNTQPDAAGNPANHIHCVWRDPNGDFGIAQKQ